MNLFEGRLQRREQWYCPGCRKLQDFPEWCNHCGIQQRELNHQAQLDSDTYYRTNPEPRNPK